MSRSHQTGDTAGASGSAPRRDDPGDLRARRLRVVLADDHDMVRAGLRSILESFGNLEVVGEAGDGRAALEIIAEQQPHVALLDITMPELNGIEVTRKLRERWPEIRTLILSVHTDEEHVLEALDAGATGYVQKHADESLLRSALQALRRGERFVGPEVSEEGLAAHGAPEEGQIGGLARLTPRQREVLQLVAEGYTSREIAGKLDLSQKTIESHRRNIRDRLEIGDLAGLVRFAVRTGLVPPDV